MSVSPQNSKNQIKRRGGFITKEQKQILINYIEQHPELKSGKFTQSFTVKEGQSLWLKVTGQLNAAPGAQKTWQKWRKVRIFDRFFLS